MLSLGPVSWQILCFVSTRPSVNEVDKICWHLENEKLGISPRWFSRTRISSFQKVCSHFMLFDRYESSLEVFYDRFSISTPQDQFCRKKE